METDTLVDESTIEDAARAGVYFRDFTRVVFGWVPRPHQEPWYDALQDLADGKLLDANGKPTNKLMILAPPGSGKTDTMIEYNAWVIGRALEQYFTGNDAQPPQVGYVAYADDVASLRSMAIRNSIEFNPMYSMVFPFAEPDKSNRWSSHEWFLRRLEKDVGKKDPTVRASGLTGQILSYRFPTLITLDDPHDPKNVKTEGQRDEVWRIWRTTVRTRAREHTPIVLICTRWAEDDLAGRLMEVEDDWCVVHTSALDDEDETYWPPEGNGFGFTSESFHRLRDEDKDSFLTQYMALPPSSVGDVFRWWTYGPRPTLQEVDKVIHAYDTAQTEKSWSSYSVRVKGWLLKSGRLYIEEVWRKRIAFAGLLDEVARAYWEDEAIFGDKVMVIVENKANALPLVSMSGIRSIKAQDLPRHDRRGKRAPGQQMDLVSRSGPVSKYFETRHVVLPESWTPWKDDYLTELKAFPRVKYNDQVSATILLGEYAFPPRFKNFGVRMPIKRVGLSN